MIPEYWSIGGVFQIQLNDALNEKTFFGHAYWNWLIKLHIKNFELWNRSKNFLIAIKLNEKKSHQDNSSQLYESVEWNHFQSLEKWKKGQKFRVVLSKKKLFNFPKGNTPEQ